MLSLREGRARPTLRLPVRPLWCTARCLRRTPLGRRSRPDIPAADLSAGAPGAVHHRGQKGDFRPDSPSPTGRTGCSSRYARVDQRLFSTRVSPAQRAVHHSPQTKRRPEALTQSASPNSQDASQATLDHPQQKGLFTFVSEIFISETLQDPHVIRSGSVCRGSLGRSAAPHRRRQGPGSR